jgi:hypothetical protein
MADDLNTGNKFINSIDITSENLLLLSTRDQFYLLGWGGIVPFGKRTQGNIGSFAYTPDKLLMTIRNEELCVFDDGGNLEMLYSLPSSEMGISRGQFAMYIFDRNGSKQKQAVYVLARGGKYSRLFEVPRPVYSLIENGNKILFTNGNTIYQYSLDNKEMKAVASLPDDMTIRSLTMDKVTGIIYFSTDNMIFSLKGTDKGVLTDQIGGKLMFHNGLIVFNPEKKLLIRITGMDSKTTQSEKASPVIKTEKPSSDILTNESVIGFVRDKLSDGVIINIIKRSKVNFDLGVDSMVSLANNNVSSAVIMAMKDAMKNQSGK